MFGRKMSWTFLVLLSAERRYGLCLAGILVVCSRDTLGSPCAAFGSDSARRWLRRHFGYCQYHRLLAE
jgi:hypothetical protein